MAGWIAPGDDDDVDVATSSVTKVVTQVETCKALASGCEHYVFQGPVASEFVGKKKSTLLIRKNPGPAIPLKRAPRGPRSGEMQWIVGMLCIAV